jgi:arsenate reductase
MSGPSLEPRSGGFFQKLVAWSNRISRPENPALLHFAALSRADATRLYRLAKLARVKVKAYAYSKCSTCRKALAFLKGRDVDTQAVDIVTTPPSKTELQRIQKLAGVPVKKLFNTSGQSYREGRFGERLATMTDAQAFEALANDGKLIKRPLVVGSDFALVGFDESAYAKRF